MITEVNPFYLLLPYLWSDLVFGETAKGNYSMKNLDDTMHENRASRSPVLEPISKELIEVFTKSEILLETIKKACIW